MKPYTYRPYRFYAAVFALTWGFWIAAAVTADEQAALSLLLLGLCMPAVTALLTVLLAGNCGASWWGLPPSARGACWP